MMVDATFGQHISFGGSAAPAAFVELKIIGDFGHDTNVAYNKGIAEFLQTHLGSVPLLIYHSLTAAQPRPRPVRRALNHTSLIARSIFTCITLVPDTNWGFQVCRLRCCTHPHCTGHNRQDPLQLSSCFACITHHIIYATLPSGVRC